MVHLRAPTELSFFRRSGLVMDRPTRPSCPRAGTARTRGPRPGWISLAAPGVDQLGCPGWITWAALSHLAAQVVVGEPDESSLAGCAPLAYSRVVADEVFITVVETPSYLRKAEKLLSES